MGYELMLRPLMAGAMLLLAACSQEEASAPAAEDDGAARIASLEDYGAPVDKSDQITAIDAATGDASGMPRDGGAVVKPEKPDPRPAVEAPEAAANAAIPVIAAPPPPPAAPALTIPLGN